MTNPTYPRWLQRWNETAEEIDARIIDFFKTAGRETGELTENIRVWLNGGTTAQVGHEPPVVAEVEAQPPAAEPDDLEAVALLHEKIQGRVDELEGEGRLSRYKAEAGQPEEKVFAE